MKKRFSYSCFSLPQREFVFSLYTIRARDKERSILTISFIFSVRDWKTCLCLLKTCLKSLLFFFPCMLWCILWWWFVVLLLSFGDPNTIFHSSSKTSKLLIKYIQSPKQKKNKQKKSANHSNVWITGRGHSKSMVPPTFFRTLSSTSSPAVLNSSTASLCVWFSSVIPLIYRTHMKHMKQRQSASSFIHQHL